MILLQALLEILMLEGGTKHCFSVTALLPLLIQIRILCLSYFCLKHSILSTDLSPGWLTLKTEVQNQASCCWLL